MLRTLHHPNGPRQIHLGGWKKQHTDSRDEAYRIKLHSGLTATPTSWDNRNICSPIEDQESLGSCTANMFAGMIEANEIKAGRRLALDEAAAPKVVISGISTAADGTLTYTTTITPTAAPAPAPSPTPAPAPPASKLVQVSRLLHYYATRRMEGTVGEDSGATIRDSIKAGVSYGVADETLWPYDISKFTQNPPATAWAAAAAHRVTSYHALTDGDVATMKSVLAQGFLVGFGFQVYDAMMSAEMAKSGLLCKPKTGEKLQGGHAVALCGFDSGKVMPDGSVGAFLVRNSWGTAWGLSGYFWMAENYVALPSLSSDFWVVNSSPV